MGLSPVSGEANVLKVGVPSARKEPFAPQGEAPGFEFRPAAGRGARGWGWDLWRDCVSAFPTCFQASFLSFARCEGVAPPVFKFFSEEILPTFEFGGSPTSSGLPASPS